LRPRRRRPFRSLPKRRGAAEERLMIRALKSASEALRARALQQDLVANNLANLSTAGFKRELARFMRVRGKDGEERLVVESRTDFTQGVLRTTGNPLDLAVRGDGFLVVETPEGEAYTRAGRLTLSPEGRLVTARGFTVLGTSGPIQIDPTEEGSLEIATDGTVSVAGISRGTLRVVRFRNPEALEKVGSGLFRDPQGRAGREEVGTSEVQLIPGQLEGSNVQPLREMVAMIRALRAFEIVEKSAQAADEMLDVLINRVARVPSSRG
jgi:flagellar basal-body rod protein FlgF